MEHVGGVREFFGHYQRVVGAISLNCTKRGRIIENTTASP